MTQRRAAMALGAGRGASAWWPAAAAPDAARLEPFAFDAGALTAGDEGALAAAMHALQRCTADARVLHVALASPWTSPRELALPPMRMHEAQAVLTRDAARHFPVPHAEPVVAARPVRRDAWLAADADGVVLDAIGRAAHAAGFTDVRFVPAVVAWGHAAGTSTQRVFAVDDEAAVLDADAGRVTRLRRCRTADLGASRTAAAPDDALPLAASHAPWSEAFELVSAAARTERASRARTLSRRLVAAGLVAMAAGAALHVWGLERRAARIEAQRDAVHAVIAPLRATRDSLAQATDELAALSQAARQAPAWSQRLWALASALPADAYLTAWRGDGDSVIVEGRASDAAAAVERLRTARGVEAVRPMVPSLATDAEDAPFSVTVRFRPGSRP